MRQHSFPTTPKAAPDDGHDAVGCTGMFVLCGERYDGHDARCQAYIDLSSWAYSVDRYSWCTTDARASTHGGFGSNHGEAWKQIFEPRS